MKTDDRHVKKSLEETFNEMHKPKLSYPGPYRVVPSPTNNDAACVVGPAKISIADTVGPEDAQIIADALNEREEVIASLCQVSFYARINHGTKCKDYGEVVDPVLKKLGVKTGELRQVQS